MTEINYDSVVESVREAIKREDLPQWQPCWKQLPAPITSVPPSVFAQLFARTGAKVIHRDGTQTADSDPVFNAIRDTITLPPVEAFDTEADYAVAALHELTHWSGHPDRLKRPFVMATLMYAVADEKATTEEEKKVVEVLKAISDLARYHEEMIAEFGSMFLATAYGYPVNLERHAVYIKNYAKPFGEKRTEMIEDAIRRAKRAVAWLLDRNVAAEPLKEAA